MTGSKLVTCFLVPLVVASAVALAEPGDSFNGAIYTSTAGGTTVNTNTYAAKEDVYLNGGPQNEHAAGLPDGTYYFQVTDPSGATLLSTDRAECRQIKVANGVVTGYVLVANSGCTPHNNGMPDKENGSIPVQLTPFNDTPNAGGEYKVWLIRQTTQTSVDGLVISFNNKDAKSDNFKISVPVVPAENSFSISGSKYYDANANGSFDSESPVAGVKMNVSVTCGTAPAVSSTATTDANGQWAVTYTGPNTCTYQVTEVLPATGVTGSYWVETEPKANANGFQGYAGDLKSDVTGLAFGNVCFVPANGGLTLGFWSNKNGQAILKQDQPAEGTVDVWKFLGDLPLKNYNGEEFNPTDLTQFRTWLLNGKAVNMAYMLSVQLAATELDVRYGFLKAATIVDARSLGLGFQTIGDLMKAGVDALSGAGGNSTFTGSPLRQDEEVIKNALDAINNNKLPFASGTPCAVVYPTVDTTASPTL